MFYRTKPVVKEAVQFLGFNSKSQCVEFSERPQWLTEKFGNKILFFDEPNTLTIDTLEGKMKANINDFIVKGLNGELYPCKPDIFEKTYDKVSDDEAEILIGATMRGGMSHRA